MTGRLRAASVLAAWLAFVLGVVVALHAVGGRLGPPPLTGLEGARAWLEQRQPVDVVFAALRLLALALGWYLLAITIISVVARVLRLAAVVTVVDVITVPTVRRLVTSAVGLSLVASSYPGLALAAESGPPAVEVMRRLPDDAPGASATVPPSEPGPSPTITMHRLPDDPGGEALASPSPQPAPTPPSTQASTPSVTEPPPSPQPVVTSTTQAPAAAAKPTTRQPPPPAATSTPPTAPPTPEPATPEPAPGSRTVRPGDHFWAVAEQVLADAWGRPATDAEVGPYWRTLVETNRSRLTDPANPDLLFPGQILTVPTPPARPA